MRLFTMLFLPGLLLGCGKALSAYDPRQPEGLDLSFFGLTDEQFETLSRRLAVPFYSAAAVAMFLFGLVSALGAQADLDIRGVHGGFYRA